MAAEQFHEVAHSGGKVTIRFDAKTRSYPTTYQYGGGEKLARVTGLYAHAEGIPVSRVMLPGLGERLPPPPFSGCCFVIMVSDSEGKYGHRCPACSGYGRSDAWPNLCPYCRHSAEPSQFLSDAQRRYVTMYCERFKTALFAANDSEYTIDMDELAAASNTGGEKPAFYVSEESQQHKFTCEACGGFNDVTGRFAYCCTCGTRNDTVIFRQEMTTLRGRLNAADSSVAGNVVRDAISAFDNLVGQYTKQLLALVPLSKRRAERLKRGRFHDLEETVDVLRWFDIDVLKGLANVRRDALKRMFLRRHIYEHNGGEVDQLYIEKSGDTTVRLKQHISESVADVHALLGDLDRLARAMHAGFHELLPPLEEPMRSHKQDRAQSSP